MMNILSYRETWANISPRRVLEFPRLLSTVPSTPLPLPPRACALALAGFLVLLQPQPAKAETTVSYKYQDYREAGGRIGVQVNSALIETTLGTAARLRFTGVIDTIAGATPTGQEVATPDGAVPLAQMEEERMAWTADYSHQFSRVNVTLGLANSRESDYVSDGASLNAVVDFNEKNTGLFVGLSATDDTLRVFHQTDWAGKRSVDALLGMTQLFGPHTKAGLNLGWGRSTGYLNDPYKIITKRTELLPGIFLPLTFRENRPAERKKRNVFASLNHALPAARGAIDASYRLYDDSFGITSHTLAVAWFQKLGAQIIVIPSFRFYRQTAADFYRVSLTGTTITPSNLPQPGGPFYSADYRLAACRSLTPGLKVVWNPTDRLRLELAGERYTMKGRDGVTSASAFPRADIVTAGVLYAW
ncbi:MAG: hypothetical protein C0502_01860 [Opitutus sp.]|nr:hypothetical protein [Opitutus sp.]